MTHKTNICRTALAAHVEDCVEMNTFAPLIVDRSIWDRDFASAPRGLPAIVERDVQTAKEKQQKIALKKMPAEDDISDRLLEAMGEISCQFAKTVPGLDLRLQASVHSAVQESVAEQMQVLAKKIDSDVQRELGEAADLSVPDKAIDARLNPILEALDADAVTDVEFQPIPTTFRQEIPELGLFFTEQLCLRHIGLAYEPCGEEFTLLPGETIKQRRNTVTSESDEVDETVTTQDELTTTDKDNTTTTFDQSLEDVRQRNLDVKLARKLNVGAKKLFGLLDISVGNSASLDFKTLVKRTNKSSSKIVRTQVNEAVRKLKTTTALTTNKKRSFTEEIDYERKFGNKTGEPVHYIERETHCVVAAIHKRVNVQMAWSGCIDDPAEGLCTPDNIEEAHAEEIQAIRDKWNIAAPPAEFGPEPKPVSRKTRVLKKNNNILGRPFNIEIDDTIPGGFSYVGGSAHLHANANVLVQSTTLTSQPGSGARGGIQFQGNIDTRVTRKEVTYFVTYLILSDAAKTWHDQVGQWRDEQAQIEISAFINAKLAALAEWELSDRVAEHITRKIFENFFGVTSIQDCCRFIARVRSLFDFDNLSYSLLPSWNDRGDQCQSSTPVTFLTAKCLTFYLPMREGKEIDALALLASVQAVPWSANIRAQILAYVNELTTARDTLYNRLFDPTGMEPNVDGPNGIEYTAYDTDQTTEWNNLCESDLNFVLIDKHHFTIPTGSSRIEVRPDLC